MRFLKSLLLASLLIAGLSRAGEIAPAKKVSFPSPSLIRLDDSAAAAEWDKGFAAVYKTLLKNLHMPNRNFKTRYAYPSPIFLGVYLWDSSFIAQVWTPWDYRTSQDVLNAVLDNAAPDGRLKHYVSPYDKSDLTQPPVIAWSVWKTYEWGADREFLARSYPVLKRYNEWLYRSRRLPNGLFYWKHPYESGIDNSPRFVTADEKPVLNIEHLAAVDLNSYILLQNRILRDMARELELPNETCDFDLKATLLKDLINRKLWDEETGMYYDLDTDTGKLVKIKTIASLIPLFGYVPDSARAQRLRDHAMNPAEFNTWMPMPSVARNDPAFEKDCWRGPVWINTAYMAITGLRNYGFEAEATELTWKLVDGGYKNYALTKKLVEFYDPDQPGFKQLHRKHGNLYKQLTLGDKPKPNFVGWTGLVNTIIIQDLIGYKKANDKKIIDPRFPDSAAGTSFKLTLPSEGVTIELRVKQGGATQGKVTTASRTREFSLERGQALALK